MHGARRIRSLAPRVCPRCEGELTFTILEDRIECRRCGYRLSDESGLSAAAASEPVIVPPPARKRRTLRATYRVVHDGEVDNWASAAFDTAQMAIHRQEWDEAIDAFYRALDAQHDFIDAHLWLGRLLDDPEKRREHLAFVLAHKPGYGEAIQELMILDGKLPMDTAAYENPYLEPERREAGGAVDSATENVRCPRCGALRLSNDYLTGLMVCDACNYVLERPSSADRDEPGMLTEALLKRRSQPVQWIIGERLLRCNSCGAERTIPARKLSDVCVFCGSKHVIQQDVLKSFQQPDGLVPFTIGKQEAEANIQAQLDTWVERIKGWFNTNAVQRTTIEGVYLPFWVFDAMVEVRQTITRDPGGSYGYNRERKQQQTLPAYESFTTPDAVNNVLVPAVKSPSLKLTMRLGQYKLNRMVEYTPSLLAQHAAELYSIDFDRASLEARSMIGQRMRKRYSRSTSGQVTVFTSVTHMNFQLVLLPVWVATLVEEDGDIRTALVNGQTGRAVLGKVHRRIDT